MMFGHSQYLILLAIIPALAIFWIWARRKSRADLHRILAAESIDLLVKRGLFRRRLLKFSFFLTAMLFAIIALADPLWGSRMEEIKRKGVDVVIAVDVSDSMMASDTGDNVTRLKRATYEFQDLLAALDGDRVGLVAFAGTAFLQCPLTADHSAVRMFLDELSPSLIPVPGTDLGAAIDTAVRAFDANSSGTRAIILITDGEDHGGEGLAAAKRASELHIPIYIIGMGEESGAPVPEANGGFIRDNNGIVLSKLDEEGLKRIANESHGAFVRSDTGDRDLKTIVNNGLRKTLAMREFESEKHKRHEHRFQWPLGIAIIFLAASFLIPETRRSP